MKLLFVILFPIITSLCLLKIKNKKVIDIITFIITIIESVFVWYFILKLNNNQSYEIIKFTDQLSLTLGFDGLGKYFAGIVSVLYPLTCLYAFEYLENDERQSSFFFFFMMAYGVTVGITMARNFFSLYIFYELLTLSTMPLVLHDNNKASIQAAKTYLYISIGGAALVFVSMVYYYANPNMEKGFFTSLFYLLAFFGFGVKAAVFPLHFWLPKASVAPTPVTALLHAVAVVKAGVFAIIRLTYYLYGTELIKDSFAIKIALIFASFTIVYGSSMAVKETHFKRRMAYSTVANLSYILFGVLLLTKQGLAAGLLHMAYHAEIKILAFFAVGAIMHNTDKTSIYELDGLGKAMPITLICYSVAALALTGIPPLSGFVSKAYLIMAGFDTNNMYALIGIVALLLSALLTAIYSLSPIRRAFFPDKDSDLSSLKKVKDVKWPMLVVMSILALAIIVTGFKSEAIYAASSKVATEAARWLR